MTLTHLGQLTVTIRMNFQISFNKSTPTESVDQLLLLYTNLIFGSVIPECQAKHV